MLKRLEEPFQDVGALLGLAQIISSAPPNHVDAVVDEKLDGFDERQDARLAVNNGQHDHAEVFLELGMFVEVVQDNFRLLAALQLHHNAHPVAVRLVANVGDALDLLLLNELRDALDDFRLVHLVGYFRDDDLLLFFGGPLDGRLGAHGELAAARPVGGEDPLAAVDEAGRREVRPLDVVHEPVDGDFGVADHGDRPVDHLPEIVGRNVRRHADGDAGGAVQEQQRDPRRQDGRLLQGFVVVRREIDGVLLQVG